MQNLTDEQKAQARANINADRFKVKIYRDRGTPYSDKTAKEIYDAFASGKTVEITVDIVRAMLTECRMVNDKYYISCYVPRVTEAYTVVGLGSYMLYLDGVLGTSRGMWKEGLYNVTATAELAPITGVVTADKLQNPDHPTDLVAYEAFQAAVPLVQGMNLTGAQVGQTIKVKAVNEQGMPTAWEAADMQSGGCIRWQHIKEITLTEQTNSIVIGEDDNGVSVADYNPIAMKVEFNVPADSTQTNNNGVPWLYPSATHRDNGIRVIGTIAAWKTTERHNMEFFIGDIDGIFAGGNVNAQLVLDPSNKPNITVMNGVTLFINGTNDHWPVGTIVSLEVLSGRA